MPIILLLSEARVGGGGRRREGPCQVKRGLQWLGSRTHVETSALFCLTSQGDSCMRYNLKLSRSVVSVWSIRCDNRDPCGQISNMPTKLQRAIQFPG
jgi:hypothetical protein